MDLSLSTEERTRMYKVLAKQYRDNLNYVYPDDEQRLDLMIELYYKQKIPGQMFWDCCGALYIQRIGGVINADI